MKTRIRQWLRSLIQWDDWMKVYGKVNQSYDERLSTMQEKLDKLEKDVERLRSRRDHTHAPLAVTDFETVQAMFLNDPKNYETPKEMN